MSWHYLLGCATGRTTDDLNMHPDSTAERGHGSLHPDCSAIARASLHSLSDVNAVLSRCGGSAERAKRLVEACDVAGMNAAGVLYLAMQNN